ncbi:MAG: phenylalanine--tRNA ligase subunit beta [Rickettsiales bacterium]|jgi:phenylalanyl-tRNA synthetase beta chain|nr:phenylalanine--tRNA ligase subunit beta [Rickettsiales bacterium]
MKFTLSWLREYLETSATVVEIIDTLNKIGLEVENVEDRSENLKCFYCVVVEECTNHPNSDHLHVCKVRTKNSQELLTIVCGAPNVRSNLKAILAPAGSTLPGGLKIEKTKIRGVESNGMLCSERELGLGEDHRGIIEIDTDIPLGTNVAKIFGLDEQVIEISITPNRGDCLGIYGIARDLACAGLGKLRPHGDFLAKQPAEDFKSNIKLNVIDNNCPVFTFRQIRNLKNCESPEWLKNRLKLIGINPKSALVDISNYVMMSFNKPLHCYDANRIENGVLNVTAANGGENFIDLFGNKYVLPQGATVICDDNKILCLGGIVGAKEGCSSFETTDVLVESAVFDPINTSKTGRLLNIQTDSRYRFERGSDYNTVDFALNYACQLILEICGGEISAAVKYEQNGYKKYATREIELNISYTEKVLGLKIDRKDIISILKRFDYTIEENDDVLKLGIPLYKNNILVREDIIDDIIRIYGYDKLKNRDFVDVNIFEKEGNLFDKKFEDKLYQIRQKLISNGFVELITYSFLNEKDDSNFCEINGELNLINPIISDLSHMRQSMLTNILNIIKKNNNRGFENLSFFEIGKVYKECKIDSEDNVLAGVRYGKNSERNIYDKPRDFDIFDIKKDLFDVLTIFKINGEKMTMIKNAPKHYHPNRSATVCMGKIPIGYFGELHPGIFKYFELKNKPVIFEFFVDKLPKKMILEEQLRNGFKSNDFQAIDRDFAFIVDKKLDVGNVIRDVYDVSKEHISKVTLFDIYEMSDKKSIAFNIKIQPKDRNFEKGDTDKICDGVINLVKVRYGGILRDNSVIQ